MATFLLTAGDDTFTGTASDDVFDGYPNGATGGIDKLNGGGGNDLFQIGSSSKGTINGGAGIDTVELEPDGTGLGTTIFTDVEVLSLVSSFWGVRGSIAQFGSFASIEHIDDSLTVRLTGAGGVLDFSTRFGAGQSVEVTNSGMLNGYTITGTAYADTLFGTGDSDILNGGAGNDYISGFAGADTLNGDDGNDEIYGNGSDIVDGGVGNDTIYLDNFTGSASGGTGNDIFDLGSFSGDNFNIDGGAGRDILTGNGDLGSGTFSAIETLTSYGGHVLGSIAQINSFERLDSSGMFYLSLRGDGGVLDFSTKLSPGNGVGVSGLGMSDG